jgi:hypothetical protein
MDHNHWLKIEAKKKPADDRLALKNSGSFPGAAKA